MEKACKVVVKEVSILSIEESGKAQRFKGFDELTEKIEKFLKILEKKFHDVILYMGTDVFDEDVVERFMFKNSGFMEIIFKEDTEINAFFPSRKRAKMFSKALNEEIGRAHV